MCYLLGPMQLLKTLSLWSLWSSGGMSNIMLPQVDVREKYELFFKRFASLFFNHEDGGIVFFQNVC
jgi:hypothetical protein